MKARVLLFGLLALLLPSTVLAGTPGLPPANVSRAEEYTRTEGASWIWGATLTDTSSITIVKIDSSTTTPMLFRCNAQVLVTALEHTQAKHHRSAVLACWVQDDSPTIAMGTAVPGTSPTEYDLGAGVGNITSDADGNNGQGACFTVHAGAARYNMLLCSEFQKPGPLRATYRTTACDDTGSNATENQGRPCFNAADCYDGSACVGTERRRGAYLALISTTTTAASTVEMAR